jgi:hypothetical protein
MLPDEVITLGGLCPASVGLCPGVSGVLSPPPSPSPVSPPPVVASVGGGSTGLVIAAIAGGVAGVVAILALTKYAMVIKASRSVNPATKIPSPREMKGAAV